MAVYKRSYRGYTGPYTPAWSRFLILSRYASENLFKSRFMTGFFVVCLFPFLITALLMYISHSSGVLSALHIPAGRMSVFVNAEFFKNFIGAEVGFAFILAAFVGPGLVSPDLTNNALALYFSRSLTRTEYVLGKFTVLAKLLSYITWIPGLLLFLIESTLSGPKWMWDNLFIAGAIFFGCWILIIVLSLLALALSAWVKWKPVAGALVLGVMFLGAGFGAALNNIMRVSFGTLLSIPGMLQVIWESLFRLEPKTEFAPWAAWVGLTAIAAACLWLLSRKLRAYEVVG